MHRTAFTLSRKFKLLIVLATLGVALTLSQVGWSAPEAISVQTLMTRLASDQAPLVLDVRSAEEFAAGHIPGAINMPFRQVPERLDELQAITTDIVVYCEVGVRAAIAELALEQAGFEQILTLDGDIQAWRQAGLPLETD